MNFTISSEYPGCHKFFHFSKSGLFLSIAERTVIGNENRPITSSVLRGSGACIMNSPICHSPALDIPRQHRILVAHCDLCRVSSALLWTSKHTCLHTSISVPILLLDVLSALVSYRALSTASTSGSRYKSRWLTFFTLTSRRGTLEESNTSRP